MHHDDRVEIVLRHIPDPALAQIAGDVDQNLDLAELLDALIDHQERFKIVGDRVVIGDVLAAGFFGFSTDVVRRGLLGFLRASANYTNIV